MECELLMKVGPKSKKPYREPNLRLYGDIRLITQTIHHGQINDSQGMKSA